MLRCRLNIMMHKYIFDVANFNYLVHVSVWPPKSPQIDVRGRDLISGKCHRSIYSWH